APFDRIGVSQRFHDLNDLRPGGNAFFPQLLEAGLGGGAGFISILKYAIFATSLATACGMAIISLASGFGWPWSGRRHAPRPLAEPAQDLSDNVADQILIYCTHIILTKRSLRA